MDRKTALINSEIMRFYAKGGELQSRPKVYHREGPNFDWMNDDAPQFNFHARDYRKRPEKVFRPLEAEEVLKKLVGSTIYRKRDGAGFYVASVAKTHFYVVSDDNEESELTFRSALENYIDTDDQTIGIEVDAQVKEYTYDDQD